MITELKFVEHAFADRRLFILDYYDAFMAYLTKTNELPSAKAYATRTFLFLKDDGTLKPLAIELSKPSDHPNVETTVVLPADKVLKVQFGNWPKLMLL